jgi:3-oxoacyl-[acyl-carrier-protein] synthase-3
LNTYRSAGIVGTGMGLPERVLTNFDLEQMVDTTDEWIRTRTGIQERRIVRPGEAASDLATLAARGALEQAGVEPEEVDLIIVGTVTGDMVFPSTACRVQRRLGATRCGAMDLSAACAGFIYGLSVAAQFVSNGTYDTILVIGVDCLSTVVDWTDRNTCVLFGDGAGAVVVRPVERGFGLLGFHLGADGGGEDLLKVEAGGSYRPASLETVQRRQHYIQMAGQEVFKFAVRIQGETCEQVLEKAGLTGADIDWFIPHQANTRIIDAAARRLGLPPEKVFLNLHRYGNTSAASIPIALTEAQQEGLLRYGHHVLMAGFGAGLTWGGAVVRWSLGR